MFQKKTKMYQRSYDKVNDMLLFKFYISNVTVILQWQIIYTVYNHRNKPTESPFLVLEFA